MNVDAVASSVMSHLDLRHFYNIFLKIKNKLYISSGLAASPNRRGKIPGARISS
jgi:hypothetical protein